MNGQRSEQRAQLAYTQPYSGLTVFPDLTNYADGIASSEARGLHSFKKKMH
jgi:hypothetical protein